MDFGGDWLHLFSIVEADCVDFQRSRSRLVGVKGEGEPHQPVAAN